MFSTQTWISSNYQTFLKFPEKRVQNFNKFLEKFTQMFFTIYSFLTNFRIDFSTFLRRFSKYSTNCFSKFQQILLKTNIFSNFRRIFWTLPRSLIDILSIFFLLSQIIFQRFSPGVDKVTVEICLNFYSGLLYNFLAIFGSI